MTITLLPSKFFFVLVILNVIKCLFLALAKVDVINLHYMHTFSPVDLFPVVFTTE